MYNKILEKINSGEYKKINKRFSPDIGVSENNKTYSCLVTVDDVFLGDEKLYTIEQHIDKNSNYHTVSIFTHKTQEYYPEIKL